MEGVASAPGFASTKTSLRYDDVSAEKFDREMGAVPVTCLEAAWHSSPKLEV